MKGNTYQVTVTVRYEGEVNVPEGEDPEQWMHDHWQDYEDELLAVDTDRELGEEVGTWDDQEDESEGSTDGN